MADINRDISIEQIDYNIDINNINFTIDIQPRSNYTIELNAQGAQGRQGEKGDTGNGILSISKIKTEGNVDTYRITYTNGDYYDYTVTNASLDVEWGDILGSIENQLDLQEELNTKQDTLTAGDGISIENNVISNTRTNAEWGNITGDLSNQTDLQNVLNSKQDNLIAGENISIEDNVISSSGGGLQMFDTVLKDHILTYEESKGLALQGTYVYKEAVAGSRYGYADFYNKCLEEYENSANAKQWLKSNVTKVGSLTDDNGVLSGFSTSNYATLPSSFAPSSNTWEMVFKITTGNDVTSIATIMGGINGHEAGIEFGIATNFQIWLGSVNTSYDIANGQLGSHIVQTNTTYWVKISFNGSAYTLDYSLDGKTYINDISVSSTTTIYGAVKAIGLDAFVPAAPWLGSIDLNESYININGERFWTGTDAAIQNPNGHLFYDITQKDIVDEIFNSTGMAWMYGVDTENERIYLPRNNWYEQLTADGSEVGKSIEAGLPNITGSFSTHGLANDVLGYGVFAGSVYTIESSSGYGNGNNYSNKGGINVPFDASKSNPIYSNSDTVQTNAVKKLLYICVGNTEATSAVTDVVEVTTTENDTLPLLHHIPTDELLEHPSWLRSAGQWNDGNVYTTVYEYLVAQYVNGTEHTDTLTSSNGTEYTVTYKTVKGKKVVDIANVGQVDAVYSAIGSAWYYVINQDDMTFRLPMSHNTECYTSDPTRLGLDVSAGLPNITGSFKIRDNNGTQYSLFVDTTGCVYGSNTTESTISSDGSYSNVNGIHTLQINASRSNPIYGNSDTVTPPHTEFYLYFKVANAVQNLELLDAGEVLEAVNNVVPNNRTVWDGQWNFTAIMLFNSTAIGNYVIDLSEIIPNDGYDYELALSQYLGRTDSSGTNTQFRVAMGETTITTEHRTFFAQMEADGANFQQANGNFIMPLIGTRKITIGIFSYNASSASITLKGYRRLGTNG